MYWLTGLLRPTLPYGHRASSTRTPTLTTSMEAGAAQVGACGQLKLTVRVPDPVNGVSS